MNEHQLYGLIATYLQLQYPKIIYRFDLAADLKLTAGQAAKHKRLHPHRGYPDLFIAAPSSVQDISGLWHNTHGLYLELKKEGTRLRKKDGSWASDHIAEQAAMLERLNRNGYAAYFAVGYDEAVEIIHNYLSKVA